MTDLIGQQHVKYVVRLEISISLRQRGQNKDIIEDLILMKCMKSTGI